MKTIHLHGPLARFGELFCLDVRDAAEAVRALSVQIKGFRAAVAAGSWHVIRGPIEGGDSLDVDGLTVGLPDESEIHLLPVIEGAGGVFNVIVGAVLVVAGVVTGNPYLIAAGVGMMIGGIVQLTTSVPSSDYGAREEADQRPSFLFDGAVNTSTQGLPVPVIYGRVRVGSVVISAGLTSEEV